MTTEPIDTNPNTIPEEARDISKTCKRLAWEEFWLKGKWNEIVEGNIVTLTDGNRYTVGPGRDKKNEGGAMVHGWPVRNPSDQVKFSWTRIVSMAVKKEWDEEEARLTPIMGELDTNGKDDCVSWDGHDLEIPKEYSIEVTERVEQWKGDEVDSMYVLLKPKNHNAVIVKVTHVKRVEKDVLMMGRVVEGMKDLVGQLPIFSWKFACGIASEATAAMVEEEVEEEEEEDEAESEESEESEEDEESLFGPRERDTVSSKRPVVATPSEAGSVDSGSMASSKRDTVEQGLARLRLKHARELLEYAQNRKAANSILKPLRGFLDKATTEFRAGGLTEPPMGGKPHQPRNKSPASVLMNAHSPGEPVGHAAVVVSTARYATGWQLAPVIVADTIKRFQNIVDVAIRKMKRATYFASAAHEPPVLTAIGVAAKATCLELSARGHWNSIEQLDRTNFDTVVGVLKEGGATAEFLGELAKMRPPAPQAPKRKRVADPALSPAVVESNKRAGKRAEGQSP